MPLAGGVGDERVERVEGAVLVVDVEVVRHVVAVVLLRRRVARVEPDRVDAERLDVIEMGPDAVQVADPVTGGVGERPDVHLVDECVLPPVGRGAGLGAAGGTAGRHGWTMYGAVRFGSFGVGAGTNRSQVTVMRTRERSSVAEAAMTRS